MDTSTVLLDNTKTVYANKIKKRSSPATVNKSNTYTTASKSQQCLRCFGTAGSASGRASGLQNWVMRCWCGYLSAARCRLFAYGPADAIAIPKPHHLLPHSNPDWFYLSGTGLLRLSWKRARQTSVVIVVVTKHNRIVIPTFRQAPSSVLSLQVFECVLVPTFSVVISRPTTCRRVNMSASWTAQCKPRSRRKSTRKMHVLWKILLDPTTIKRGLYRR